MFKKNTEHINTGKHQDLISSAGGQMSHTSFCSKRQKNDNAKKKREWTHVSYCLLPSSFFFIV
jgi:hypothetical protein